MPIWLQTPQGLLLFSQAHGDSPELIPVNLHFHSLIIKKIPQINQVPGKKVIALDGFLTDPRELAVVRGLWPIAIGRAFRLCYAKEKKNHHLFKGRENREQRNPCPCGKQECAFVAVCGDRQTHGCTFWRDDGVFGRYELPQYGSRRRLLSPSGMYDEYGEVVVENDGGYYYSPHGSTAEEVSVSGVMVPSLQQGERQLNFVKCIL